MDPAVASLVGAVVGGVVVGTSNGLIERARAARERVATERKDASEIRLASRLLMEELQTGRRLIARAQEHNGYTWNPPHRELPAAVWAEHRRVLAQYASGDDWRSVLAAFREFDRLNWSARETQTEDRWMDAHLHRAPDALVPLATNADLPHALEVVDGAIRRLREMAADA